MPGKRSPGLQLADAVRQISCLLNTEDILVQTCREARTLTGVPLAFGSYISQGQEWSEGIHVIVDGELRRGSPAMRSAAFALFRRLSTARRTVTLTREAGPRAIFDGLPVREGTSAQSLCAVPIFRRSGRIAAEIILADTDPGRFDSADEEALELLAGAASVALENALKFAAAKRDQDRLHLLAEASEEALWDWNLEKDEIWWGGGIQNLLGRGGATVEASPKWKFARIFPSDVERVQQSLNQALASTQSSWREEYRFRRADGSWVSVEDQGYFLRAADGRAYRVIGSLRDISEKKRIEDQQAFLVSATAALAESLDMEVSLGKAAQAAVSSIADWCTIALLDEKDGKPRRVALAHRDVALVQRMRAPIERFIAEASAPIGATYVLRTGEPQLLPHFEEAHTRAIADGQPFIEPVVRELTPYSLMAVPMKVAGGRMLGAITLMTTDESRRGFGPQDLTLAEEFARRCAIAIENAQLYQQAQEAIRVRDEFLSIASHELKTPLTPLLLQLHTLATKLTEYARPEKQDWLAKRLGTIRRQSGRLNRLISELLDISRIIGGQLQLSPEPLDLVALIRQVVGDFKDQGEMTRAQAEVRLQLADSIPGRWDSVRLEQVITNLLSNALKYGAGKPVTLSAEARGEVAQFTVEDGGIGIAPRDQERIFGRFERAVSARHYGGLGLGLFIVRQIVEAMGGTIRVESELGAGAKFTVQLPLEPQRERPGDTSPHEPAPETAPEPHPAAAGNKLG